MLKIVLHLDLDRDNSEHTHTLIKQWVKMVTYSRHDIIDDNNSNVIGELTFEDDSFIEVYEYSGNEGPKLKQPVKFDS
jgi:hypothetical protein